MLIQGPVSAIASIVNANYDTNILISQQDQYNDLKDVILSCFFNKQGKFRNSQFERTVFIHNRRNMKTKITKADICTLIGCLKYIKNTDITQLKKQKCIRRNYNPCIQQRNETKHNKQSAKMAFNGDTYPATSIFIPPTMAIRQQGKIGPLVGKSRLQQEHYIPSTRHINEYSEPLDYITDTESLQMNTMLSRDRPLSFKNDNMSEQIINDMNQRVEVDNLSVKQETRMTKKNRKKYNIQSSNQSIYNNSQCNYSFDQNKTKNNTSARQQYNHSVLYRKQQLKQRKKLLKQRKQRRRISQSLKTLISTCKEQNHQLQYITKDLTQLKEQTTELWEEVQTQYTEFSEYRAIPNNSIFGYLQVPMQQTYRLQRSYPQVVLLYKFAIFLCIFRVIYVFAITQKYEI